MTSRAKTKTISTQKLTRIAILVALATILFYVEVPIVPPIYKLDLSNLPVLLGAFSMGPVSGIIILGLKSLIHCLQSSTQYVGELADFIMGTAYILPAALLYGRKRNRKTAVLGMVAGTIAMALVAVVVNWQLMIPFFSNAFHMPIDTIIAFGTKVVPFVHTELEFLLFVTAPFNLLKGLVISVLTYLLYKRLSPLLHVGTR